MLILFVDDDAEDFETFHEAFVLVNPSGRVIHERDGGAALRFLRKQSNPSPDYILLDINMPVMNGIECLIELKADARLKEIPVIMYSTSIDLSQEEI